MCLLPAIGMLCQEVSVVQCLPAPGVRIYIQDTPLTARGECKRNSPDLLPDEVSVGHIHTLAYSNCHVQCASYIEGRM
jgi:hypothetical protein